MKFKNKCPILVLECIDSETGLYVEKFLVEQLCQPKNAKLKSYIWNDLPGELICSLYRKFRKPPTSRKENILHWL